MVSEGNKFIFNTVDGEGEDLSLVGPVGLTITICDYVCCTSPEASAYLLSVVGVTVVLHHVEILGIGYM